MKRTLISAAALLLTSAQAALAHPGHHDGMSAASLIEHLWHSPFHALPLSIAAVLIGGLAFTAVKLKARRASKVKAKDRT